MIKHRSYQTPLYRLVLCALVVYLGSLSLSSCSSDDETDTMIIEQPKDLSVTVGKSAIFEVKTVGNNVRYQWRRNGVDIPGRTFNPFEIYGVALSDNGAKFSVKITNQDGNGSEISREATLTVTP